MTYNTDDKRFKRYVYVKRRIAKAQDTAKTVGMLYLLATVAVIALFCLGIAKIDGASLTVLEFYKIFLDSANATGQAVSSVVVYALTLFVMAVLLIKSLLKLKWLFSRKASRLYGFNRNAYAMDDMGRYFSLAFACGIAAGFVIALTATGFEVELLGYAFLAAGLAFHFVLGLIAGSVSVFNTDEGITEQKREVGYFAPVFRNLLQLGATAATLFLFVQKNTMFSSLADLMLVLSTDGFNGLLANPLELIVPVAQVILFVSAILMIFYATGTKEFDLDGADTPGRKLFLVWSLIALVGAAGTYVGATFLTQGAMAEDTAMNFLIVGVIALVMVVAELCLIGCPAVNYEKLDDMDAKDFIRANANNNQPNVYMHYEVNNESGNANGYRVYGLDE